MNMDYKGEVFTVARCDVVNLLTFCDTDLYRYLKTSTRAANVCIAWQGFVTYSGFLFLRDDEFPRRLCDPLPPVILFYHVSGHLT